MAAEHNGNGDGSGDNTTQTATEQTTTEQSTVETQTESPDAGAPKESFLHRLYVGTGAFNIVGNRKRWYMMFLALLVISIAAIGIRGFHFGIDFEGGTQIQFPSVGAQGPISVEEAKSVFDETVGQAPEEVQLVGAGGGASLQIRSETLEQQQVAELKQAILQQLKPLGPNGEPSINAISVSAVSASWGSEISQQALIALGVFLVLVTIFLAVYFERWMAVAALLALLHDIVVTAGIYALVGFEVTPATVIGLLTILGFSLYDTVVVFDKVKENTRGLLGLTRRTYGEAANLALNQTLMRSINTSVIAVLPVIGLLVVGYFLLGAGTLQELALVQLIGMIVGVMSSVLLATPVLVDFKMRDSRFKQQAERVRARRANRRKPRAPGEDVDLTDDDELAGELRKEKAAVAAAGVPARNPKSTPGRGGPSGKAGRKQPAGKRPAGKQSAGNQSAGKQPAGKQPADKRKR